MPIRFSRRSTVTFLHTIKLASYQFDHENVTNHNRGSHCGILLHAGGYAQECWGSAHLRDIRLQVVGLDKAAIGRCRHVKPRRYRQFRRAHPGQRSPLAADQFNCRLGSIEWKDEKITCCRLYHSCRLQDGRSDRLLEGVRTAASLFPRAKHSPFREDLRSFHAIPKENTCAGMTQSHPASQ
jgi:hypothetical protein